jgi:hypothetical protein
VGDQGTDFGELPGRLRGGVEGGWAFWEVGEDAEEEGVGHGQEGAVALGGVVEEGGAVAGAGVEVSEAFAVFAA